MSRPWSYSRKGTYTDCPKQYWYKYVERLPGFRPASTAANRGQTIHAAAEDYLKAGVMYPKELQKVAGHAMAIKGRKAIPELKYAVTETWEACDYEAPEAYFRGIIDITYESDEGKTLHIEDWKTGQVYPEHAKQLEEYVALAAPQWPLAEEYATRLIYIDQGVVTPIKKYAKEKLKPIRIMMDAVIQSAESDTIFPETPSTSACRWCDYHAKHGGPCTKGR